VKNAPPHFPILENPDFFIQSELALYFVLKMKLSARFFSLVLAVLALLGASGVLVMDAQAEARQNEAARTNMVLSIVNGIINYTRWPHLEGKLKICLIGESDYFKRLDGLSAAIQTITGVPASFITTLDNPEEAAEQCNLLYVGHWRE